MKNKTKHARNLHLIEMKKFLNWTAEQIWKIMMSIDRGASFSCSSFASIKKNLSSRTLDETIMRHDAQRLQWLFYTNEIPPFFLFLFWFPLEKLLPFSLGSDRCNPSVKLSAIIEIQKNGISDARFPGDDWQHQVTIVDNFRCGYIYQTHTWLFPHEEFSPNVSFPLCLTAGWIKIFHRSEKQLKRKIKNHGSLSLFPSLWRLVNEQYSQEDCWVVFIDRMTGGRGVLQPNKKKKIEIKIKNQKVEFATLVSLHIHVFNVSLPPLYRLSRASSMLWRCIIW